MENKKRLCIGTLLPWYMLPLTKSNTFANDTRKLKTNAFAPLKMIEVFLPWLACWTPSKLAHNYLCKHWLAHGFSSAPIPTTQTRYIKPTAVSHSLIIIPMVPKIMLPSAYKYWSMTMWPMQTDSSQIPVSKQENYQYKPPLTKIIHYFSNFNLFWSHSNHAMPSTLFQL